MTSLNKFYENAVSTLPDNNISYDFKRKLYSEITEKANELTHSGLDDEKVICDLIFSEHTDILSEYQAYESKIKSEKKAKSLGKIKVFSVILYLLIITVSYLALSFLTGKWSQTWSIPVCGICTVLFAACISKVLHNSQKGKKMIFSRILLAVSVFLIAAGIFTLMITFGNLGKAWLVFIVGVIIAFTFDGIFIEKAKMRFSIFFHLSYIVPSFAMFYIILAALSVIPWNPGWIMIPASLIIIIAVILIRIIISSKEKEAEQWTEN